jgi:trimeric autotransporter adhesin
MLPMQNTKSKVMTWIRIVGYICATVLLCAVAGALQPAWATLPTPNQSILVVQDSTSADPYQNFVPELLLTEGLNGFQSAQLPELTASFLANYDVVILPHLALTSAEAALLQNYVNAGGTLVAFRPDLQLSNVFGVAQLGTTLAEGWLKIDTTTSYSSALDPSVMKFHGTADLYSLNGAKSVATLYSSSASPTDSPAAAIYSFGSGKAILFSFDLTQSIVLMRQGNPAWAGYPNNHDGNNTMRASQMFMDQGTGQFWNDLGDGALNDVPQADIQLHLFSNLVTSANAPTRPLPRLWYYPNQNRSMLLMTADEHAFNSDLSGAVTELSAVQTAGGKDSIFLWYPYGLISNAQVTSWLSAGHTVGVHFDDTAEVDASGIGGSAASWNGMQNVITSAMSSFTTTYPTAPPATTTRDHFLIWLSRNAAGNPDQTAQAKLFQAAGIQLDVSYTAFPLRWGYMTGSGLPMKFLDVATGTVIPVYEQATEYEDDVQLGGSTYSFSWDVPTAQSHYQKSLSDSMTNYNTVITMLFHPDHWTNYAAYAQTVLSYAQSHSIPMYTTGDWLAFWKGRTATTFSKPTFVSNTLSFTVTGAPNGLTVLLPDVLGNNKVLATFLVDNVPQNFTTAAYQGLTYASAVLTAGTHTIAITYVPAGRILGQVSPSAVASSTTIQVQGGSISQSVSVAADGTYAVGPLPAGTYTVTPVSQAATFSPTSQSITLNTTDVTGVNFAATQPIVGETLFTTQAPSVGFASDAVNYELGMAFTSTVGGQITGVRFWKAAGDTGTHIGKLWSSSGQLLTSVTFSNETASGWQQQALVVPVWIAANTRYVVSVNTANTDYVVAYDGLEIQVVNQHLRSAIGNNGVFASAGQFPTNTFSSSNYFRDVFFVPSSLTLSSMTLNPTSVFGGGTSTGTVTLTNAAPPGGAAVALQSNNPAATVPASVTVPEGAMGATFTIATGAVQSNVSATITASFNGTAGSATLTINAVTVSSLSLNPTAIAGGNSSIGTVTLGAPAPPSGAVVALTDDRPITAGIMGVYSASDLPSPGSVDWGTFGPDYTMIQSGTVTPVNGLPGLNMTISNTAAQDMEALSNCNFGGACPWYGNFADGAHVLWLSGTYYGETGWWAGNGPLTIQFDSPQRGIGFQAMGDELGPLTATICAYNSSNALLGCVPFTGNGTGVADGSAAFMGIYDDAQEISKVTIDAGGQLYPHDFAISQLFVTGTRRQFMPASVTVPAGATSASFSINATPVQASTTVHITATYQAAASATLTINPTDISSVTFTPASVSGGTSLTGTVTLNGTAPAGGTVVTLSSDNPVSTGVQLVNSSTAILHDNTVMWTDLGPSFTSIAAGTAVPIPGAPGSTVTVSNSVGDPLYIFTSCPAFADCGFSGNFVPAAPLLWVDGNYDATGTVWTGDGPLTLIFNTPKHGVGFNIMADEAGPFSGTICAYNTSNTLIGCEPFNGTGAPLAGGTNGMAIFTGIYDDTAEIGKVTIDAGGQLYPHDFAINQLVVATSRRMVPPSVTVQAGANAATFPVNTDTVSAVTTVGITGTYQTAHVGTLTVNPPPALVSLTMNPGNVVGGGSSTGTVTLNVPAPAGGALVSLSSSNAAASVPASVTIAAGATSATITATTIAVTNSTSATITATFNALTKTAALAINPLAISGIVMNPASVGGGTSSTGTVTLNGPAPAGGAVVILSDNNASATTPASVTVAASATSATFTVTTAVVATVTPVTITGTYNTSTQTAALTLNPRGIATLAMSPATVFGGSSSTGTVTLNSPAPTGGAVVTLSDNSASSTTPANVTVAAGATTATFTVTTSVVAASTAVTITSTYNGSTATAGLTIRPLTISTLAMNPTTVFGGNSSTGTVTLNGPAPTGGAVVTLSDNSASSTTPANVTVAAGTTSATFTVTTVVVAASTPVTVTATYNGSTQTAGLTISPVLVSSVTLSPFSLISGATSTGTVTLNAPAAGTAAQRTVTLSSNSAAATVPANVAVAAGATTATFTVTSTFVSAPTPVTITGTLNGSPQTAALTVNPVIVTAVTMNPAALIGGGSSTGTVTLNAPAIGTAAQRTVTLADNSASSTTPANVQVAAGATTATFTVTTSVVTAVTPVTITATYDGSTPTATLTINPVVLASVAMNPIAIGGGGPSTGTVTLNAPAAGTAAQRTVTLADNSAVTTTPATVVVASGATTANFTVTSTVVAASTPVTITATYNGSTQTAVLTINPTALATLVMNPPTAAGGSSSVGTVTLNGPAPTGGALVTLSDNSASSTTPASVTVAAGASSANFTVTTVAVATSTPVTISATYSGATLTATLTINPLAVSNLTIVPNSVGSGVSPVGTVTLNGPAPTGGALVALSNSNPTAATVPVSVTVAAGATSANFSILTAQVASATTVTVTASYNGSTLPAVLTVNPLAPSTVTLNPATVSGVSSSTGTVTLNGPAPVGGAIVGLSSNNASATVPASVTIAAGATSTTFTVTTVAVANSTSATITATYNGLTQTGTLTLSAVAFVKSAGNSGESVPYTVSIAPAAGNFLAVFVWQIEGTAAAGTVSDNAGSTYTQDCNLLYDQGFGGTRRLTVYHLLNAPGGITTVTVTPSRPSRAIVAEYSGMSAGAALDVCGTVNNQTTAVTSWTSTAATTTGNDLVFGLADTGSSGNIGYSASGSWTGRAAQHDAVDTDDSYFEDRINVLPGSYTATGATTTAGREGSVVVGFKTGP